MSSYHTFKAALNWKLNPEGSTHNSSRISRNHQVSIAGKQVLEVSAAKAFKGDASLHNPEDLLLSALTSCHMMSYLYVCAQHDIEVLAYSDKSEGQLEVEESGKGSFKSVDLNPVVTIKNAQNLELAKELHAQANELCFIANSCNFPIHHNATILLG
jgi:organic hydroperoxide reductase OsmC/OhrA